MHVSAVPAGADRRGGSGLSRGEALGTRTGLCSHIRVHRTAHNRISRTAEGQNCSVSDTSMKPGNASIPEQAQFLPSWGDRWHGYQDSVFRSTASGSPLNWTRPAPQQQVT